MKNRVIEVSTDGRYLHADRGFLVIRQGKKSKAEFRLTTSAH